MPLLSELHVQMCVVRIWLHTVLAGAQLATRPNNLKLSKYPMGTNHACSLS